MLVAVNIKIYTVYIYDKDVVSKIGKKKYYGISPERKIFTDKSGMSLEFPQLNCCNLE